MKKLLAAAVTSVLVLLLSGVGGAAFASAQNVRTISVEASPTGVAITPDGLTALVANSGSDSVSVISLNSETVTYTITVGVGDGPQDLVISPDGTTAFVTNYFSHDVSVIDIESLLVVNTISLGGAPFSMTLSADGTKAVVPDSISGIYVIDLTNYDVAYYPLETSSAPVFAAVSPDGMTAYVTGANTGSVYVVDLASGILISTYPLSLGMIYGITLNAMGDAAYVAVYGGGAGSSVVQIDVATGDVLATLTAAGAPETMTLAPDGQSLLVTTQHNGLVVLNLADSSLNETVPMGQDLRHVAINAAGTTAVVTSNADGTATLVDFDPALVAPPVVTSPDAQLPSTGASPLQSAIPLFAFVLVLAGLAVFGIRRSLGSAMNASAPSVR